MPSAFVSRWPVLQEHRVTDGDLDADGVVRDERVTQWLAGARSAYLRRCAALRRVRQASGLELQDRVAPLPPGAALGRPAAVVVTAGVREVWPSSFALAVRRRPVDGDRDGAVDVTCIVRLVDPTTGEPHELGAEVRDELIALEHAAEHYN
jgi:acyl-CoA thioesterase FadM